MNTSDFLKTDNKVFFCITGTSLMFTEQLMAYGGASKNVVGVYQPYAYEQLVELVHLGSLDKCVCEDTAKKMCIASAHDFKLPSDTIVLSCTAALCKRDGERDERINEAYICVKKLSRQKVYHIELSKYEMPHGSMMRYTQEKVLSERILTCLYDFIDKLNKKEI